MIVTTKRLLIVDDEPNVTLTLSESLQALGAQYQVDVANSGHAALELVRAAPYDIIVTDYKMPGMNGMELAQAVNRLAPATQVILMTAYGSDTLRLLAQNLSLSGFIDKPFTIKQIREVILRALEKTSPTAPDPFRSGEKQPPDGMRTELDHLQTNIGARAVMLISSGGYPVETSGQINGLDLTSVGALVAANFVAANELARLLGNNSIFKTSYHEGADYNIYAYALDRDFLLTVVFGAETKPGTVWFYTKQSAIVLNSLLAAMPAQQAALNSLHMESFASALDDLFGSNPGGLGDFMNFDEALGPGFLPPTAPDNKP